MALDSAQVRAGLGGGIYVAEIGTPAPAKPTGELHPGWAHLGFQNDDGVSLEPSQDREDFTAWQSVHPVRRVLTEATFELSFTCIQTNRDVAELYFPGSFTESDTGVHTLYIPASPAADIRSFLFEWTDGPIHNRIVLERGEVTEVEELEVARGAPVSYGMTVSAYPGRGNITAVWLTDDPAMEAPIS